MLDYSNGDDDVVFFMFKVEIEAERIWGRRTSHIKRFQLAGTRGRQLSMSTRSRIKSTHLLIL